MGTTIEVTTTQVELTWWMIAAAVGLIVLAGVLIRSRLKTR